MSAAGRVALARPELEALKAELVGRHPAVTLCAAHLDLWLVRIAAAIEASDARDQARLDHYHREWFGP